MLTQKFRKPRTLASACALILSATLASCASLTNSAATKPQAVAVDPSRVACAAFAPIRWSKADTDETLAQVKGHNAAWKALCGSRK